jgi:hypothetical protein
VVCTAAAALEGFTVVGQVLAGPGVAVLVDGQPVDPGDGGWRHR